MILKLIKFNCVKSTNDEAIKIIRSGKNSKELLYLIFKQKAEAQWGKNGFHIKETFFASIFFELKKSMPDFKEFSLINPVIIKKLLNEYSSHEVKIKWPNDLMIKNRKVCGILQELIMFEKKFF